MHIMMLDHATAAGYSAHPSFCHTLDSCLLGSRYPKTFHIIL